MMQQHFSPPISLSPSLQTKLSLQQGLQLQHPSPHPEDCPYKMREALLELHKKAISQFMSLQSMPQDDVNQRINPTHSSAINNITAKIKNMS